jgi:hypothetical protein
MPHMKCVCFVQPSEDSLDALSVELREPKYGEYYLCQCVTTEGECHMGYAQLTSSLSFRLQQHIEQSCH